MRRDMVLGASGLLFLLVTIVPVVIPHESLEMREAAANREELPPSADIAAFFERNYAMQQSQTFFHLAGLALFVVFAARLVWLLRQAPASAPWGTTAALAAAAAVAIMAVAMALVSSLLDTRRFFDGRDLLLLYDLGWSLHFKANYFTSLFLAAVSWGALRAGLFPRALAWSGLVAGAIVALSTLAHMSRSVTFLQYPAFFVLLLWALAVTVVALMGRIRVAGESSI